VGQRSVSFDQSEETERCLITTKYILSNNERVKA